MATSVVLCEGFLTKSPPEHKINRARWCRRYFQLCNVGGEILLQYYKDETCSKLKGTINLRECEQVDQGLSFETKSKLKDAHIFDVVTQRRKYFLVTETEADMLRWVQSICTACGFQSEDTLSDINDGEAALSDPAGTTVNSYLPDPIATPVTATAAQPVSTNGGMEESYIPLDECNTGDDIAELNSLPPKVSSKNSSPQQTQQQSKKKWDTMSSTSSSAPSDSAPSPPPSRPTSQVDGGITETDTYDVPPTRTSEDAPPVPMRPAPAETDSIYKMVPPSKDPTSLKFDRQISFPGNRGSFSNSDELTSSGAYDIVPASSDRSSGGMFEGGEIDDQQSPYDLVPPPRPHPPSRPSSDLHSNSVYDVPPMSPPIESTYDVLPSPLQRTQNIPSQLKASDSISKSTDDLAKSFEEISHHNASQSVTNGDLEHSTYDPVPALDLNASIGSNSSFSVFSELGASSTAMEAPPRPAKPHFMCPSTPPSSVDETYIVPTKPNQQVSPQEVRRRLSSMERRGSSGASPQRNGPNPPSIAGHHQWLDQQIPPASYINAKRPATTGAMRPSSTFSPRSFTQMRSSTISSGRVQSGVPLVFQNGHTGMVNGQPGSYMPMQGSSESSKMSALTLGGAITEDSYMPMQNQNEAGPGVYSNMSSSPPAIPRRPPRQSTSSTISVASTCSGESLPPPIDRRNKPRSTDSAILNPDMIGMDGSFYATATELPPDFPVSCRGRTRSFSRKPSRSREPQPPRTPPRPKRSIKSSSSSLGDHASISELYSVPPPQSSLQDDAYIFTDQPSPARPKIDTTRNPSIDSAIHPHPSPTLPPQSHQVEYLEIDHDSDVQSSALPPKAMSPKDQVEYIHLDLEKTKALQEVTQNREEVYRGDGTLKK